MSEQIGTGCYEVSFLVDDDGCVYALRVLYTGDWAGGAPVEVGIDDDEVPDIRGDFDVERLLCLAGFDRFTNRRRGAR